MVCGCLVLGDGCEVGFDRCMEDRRKDADVDMVDDVQGVVCVVIWEEGGDKSMSVGRIRFVS